MSDNSNNNISMTNGGNVSAPSMNSVSQPVLQPIENATVEQPVMINSIPEQPVMQTSVDSVPVQPTQPVVNQPVMQPLNPVQASPVMQPSPNFVQNPSTQSVVQPAMQSTSVNPSSMASGVPSPQMVNPQAVVPSNPQPEIPAENLQKVEIQYKPPGKFKMFALVFLFILLIGFIIFLPDITEMVQEYMSNRNVKVEVITTGDMKCTYDTTVEHLDKNYTISFSFIDNYVKEMNYTIISRGDPTTDGKELDSLVANCKLLQQSTEKIEGFFVRCDYSKGTLEERQSFDLARLDVEKLKPSFAEAGGNYPEFKYDDQIDTVEKRMNAQGYSCIREK